jgi:ABC-type multidrug transport system ATPase subunit
MICLENITKVIDHRYVLNQLNLQFGRGEWLGIIGKNGAGKTTLLRILAQLSRSTRGRILYEGKPVEESGDFRRQIGVVLEHSFLYDHLTVLENLELYGRLYAIEPLRARVAEVISLLGLEPMRKRMFRSLSKGMKQKAAIARALLHRPKFLLLDEPFDGLDEESAVRVKQLLSALHERQTAILMVSHDLEEVWQLCERVAVLHEGRITQEYVTAKEPLDLYRARMTR